MESGNRDLMDILLRSESNENRPQQSLEGFRQQFTSPGQPGSIQPPLSSAMSQQGARYHPMSPSQMVPQSPGGQMMQQGDMMGAQYSQSATPYTESSYQAYPGYPNQHGMSHPQSTSQMNLFQNYGQNGSFLSSLNSQVSQYGAQSRAMGHQGSLASQYPPSTSSVNFGAPNYYSDVYSSVPPKSPASHQPLPGSGYPSNMQGPMTIGGNGSTYPGSGYGGQSSMSPIPKPMAQSFFPTRSPVSQQINSPPSLAASYPGQSPTSPMAQPHVGHPRRSSTSPVSPMLPQGMPVYSMPQQLQQFPTTSSTMSQNQLQSSCMFAQRLEKMSAQHQYQTQMGASASLPGAAGSGVSTIRRPSFPGQQGLHPGMHPLKSPTGSVSPVQRSPPQIGKSPPPFKPLRSPPPYQAKKSPPAFPKTPTTKPVPYPTQGKADSPRQEKVPGSKSGSKPDVGAPPAKKQKKAKNTEKSSMQKLVEVAEKVSPHLAEGLSHAVGDPVERKHCPGKKKCDVKTEDCIESPTEASSCSEMTKSPKESVKIVSEPLKSFCESKKNEPSNTVESKTCSLEGNTSQDLSQDEKMPEKCTVVAEEKSTDKGEEIKENLNIKKSDKKEMSVGKGNGKKEGNPNDVKRESVIEKNPVQIENPKAGHENDKTTEVGKEAAKDVSKSSLPVEENKNVKVDEKEKKIHVKQEQTEQNPLSREELNAGKFPTVEVPVKLEGSPRKEMTVKSAFNKKPIGTVSISRSGQTPTIQATVIAKGQSAQSNQQVLVAKTAGGQMYLIQGNVLIPVQNITVQQPKGEHGNKVICVNQGQGKSSHVMVGNITPNISPKATNKAKVSRNKDYDDDDEFGDEIDEKMEIDLACREKSLLSPTAELTDEPSGFSRFETNTSSVSIQTDRQILKSKLTRSDSKLDGTKSVLSSPTSKEANLERSLNAIKAKLEQGKYDEQSERTSLDSKKRIGRPRGSKDKHKRKPYLFKRPNSNEHEIPYQMNLPISVTNKGCSTSVPSTEEPTSKMSENIETKDNKRAHFVNIPTVSKASKTGTKRPKIIPPSFPTVRTLLVQPRGGVDGEKWVCAFCGKPSNHSSLGVLYGPYKAKLSRDKTDNNSRECRSPDKVMSPGGRLPELPQELEGNAIELWMHKDCGVWSQGVYMLGRTLHGLEQAVESAALHNCSTCTELGATLQCFKRGCTSVFHFACARDSGCAFVEENFTIFCSLHK